MTLISWILVLGIAFLFGVATLRLVPVYLEYFKITSSLSSVQHEFSGQTVTVSELRKSLAKHFDIEDVRIIDKDDVKIERQGGGYMMRAQYDHRTPFIANVGFIVAFDKSVQISAAAQ
jgi:hypothetical protein